jgi:hypothetical protein
MEAMTLCEPIELQECESSPEPICCPACGGFLAEMRGFWRCLRCSFAICSGCEGE